MKAKKKKKDTEIWTKMMKTAGEKRKYVSDGTGAVHRYAAKIVCSLGI